MKLLFFIYLYSTIVISLCSSSLILLRKGNDNMWKEYKNHYQKTYNDDEDKVRKPIWNDMMSTIFDHNIQYHSGKKTYHLGLNQFSDMNHEDFLKTLTGLKNEMDCNTNSSMLYQPPDNVEIPPKANWRKRGYVTDIINQGKCGACWAFCSVAALEGQHKRLTGKLVKLSEQHLIDCSNEAGNSGCEGGQMCRAFEYATVAGGIAFEDSYPLIRQTGKCNFTSKQIGSKVGGYLEIPYGDEDALLKAVALIGPVAAGIDGSSQNFRHYRDGIYDNENCSNTTLNHAVTVIGYGSHGDKDYWLIKNSWGKSWGKGGYGKVIRNKNNLCGLASRAVFPVLDKHQDGTPKLTGSRAS